MFIEDLLLDNHATPYKIKIFRDKFLDEYYYNVYFARGKIFTGGYTRSLAVCRLKARKWFKENVEKMSECDHKWIDISFKHHYPQHTFSNQCPESELWCGRCGSFRTIVREEIDGEFKVIADYTQKPDPEYVPTTISGYGAPFTYED